MSENIFLKTIERGVKANFISFDNKTDRVTYHCKRDYSTTFKNPEEKVRASYLTELVLDYKYPKNRIDFEIKTKPDKDRIDIIIYSDDECLSPYLIVETKKDGISDNEFQEAIEQAFRYANYKRAPYAIVVAGITRTAFDASGFKADKRQKNVISDIPVKYGKAPKYKFKKGDPNNDLIVVYREDLISSLNKAQSTIWQSGKLAPTAAFDEVSKLLFCKLKDERDTPKNKYYKFQIGTNETEEEVFERISTIYKDAKKDDPLVFKEGINLVPSIVYNVIEHLQQLSLNKIDLDTKGVAFELFMKDFFIGKMGQYFTPRPVVEFCTTLLNPKKSDNVVDPSCGSGGFLLYAMDNVRKYAEKNFDGKEMWGHWHTFAKDNLYGIEINDQIARVCKMNMIIHDDGHTNIIGKDALEDYSELQKLNTDFKENYFDLVFSNPPFGATIKQKEVKYLDNFELAKDAKGNTKKTQKTEILFIERCIKLCKAGTGRIAIVLPAGVLTNTSQQNVRNYILGNCQLLASFSLPESAFSHFGAGIKSSILYLRKYEDSETPLENYPIFMAVAKQVGIDSTGRKEKNDLVYSSDNSILNQYKIYEKDKINYISTRNCYKINLADLNEEGPFNATRYIWRPTFKNATSNITEIASIIDEKEKPQKEENLFETYALIRMDELPNNPVAIDSIIYCLGSEIEGNLKIVKKGDVLLARLGPSMMNRKIVVVPKIDKKVKCILASPEFIVIRPFSKDDGFYITGVLRTDLMLRYMYSKTRGGTPSRYRLSEDDFINLDFPISNREERQEKGRMFKKSLLVYDKTIKKAENKLIMSHKDIENDL
jgi:type I restriction enzyme M protein